MSIPTQQELATCPSCGAAVRPGTDWCTLCFTDLRPVPPPVPSTHLPVMATSVRIDPETGAEVTGVMTIPCASCGAQMNPLADACPGCGVGLFDELARESRRAVTLPVVGDVMRFSRNTRMAGAAIISTGFAGIAVVLVGFVAKLF